MYNVTGYEKRDHWGFFKKIEYLTWIDRHTSQVGVWPFLCTRVETFVFWKPILKIMHVSELLFVPITTVHTFQLYKRNTSI